MVPLTVPPTVNAVGDCVGVGFPSFTATIGDPVTPLGMVKVTAASPLLSVVEPLVMEAVVGPTATVNRWLAAKPVTNTVVADPAGPAAGMGALMSRYGVVSQFVKTLDC